MLNLNLGSGSKRIEDYINVDKYKIFKPDIIHDLEESYTFVINDLVGNLMTPHILSSPFAFNQSTLQAYYFIKKKIFEKYNCSERLCFKHENSTWICFFY